MILKFSFSTCNQSRLNPQNRIFCCSIPQEEFMGLVCLPWIFLLASSLNQFMALHPSTLSPTLLLQYHKTPYYLFCYLLQVSYNLRYHNDLHLLPLVLLFYPQKPPLSTMPPYINIYHCQPPGHFRYSLPSSNPTKTLIFTSSISCPSPL